MSLEEAIELFADSPDRLAKNNYTGYWWWLRTPGATSSNAALIGANGDINAVSDNVINARGGVRPVLVLSFADFVL